MSASSKKKLRKEQNAAAMTEKQQKELKEAKTLKAYTLTFAVVMILVVAIVLGVTLSGPVIGVINRNTHAVTVGEHKLTTTDLSYFYVDAITDYYTNIYNQYYPSYGNYWQLALPFDISKPLDEQAKDDSNWGDYFVEQAIESAKGIYGLYDKAVADNHTLTEDEQKALTSYLDGLDATAVTYGYSNASGYLRGSYGDGANVKTYRNYYEVTALATSYYQKYVESLEYTNDQLRDYEKDKFNTYSSFTYATYQIKVSDYLGEGTKGADGKTTYTDEQKALALEEAKKDAESLAGSPITTIDQFNGYIKGLEINKENTKAAATQNDNVFYNSISNTDIQSWVSDSARQMNDTTVIAITQTKTTTTDKPDGDKSEEDKETEKETTGYYVVYFVERNDNLTNLTDVRHILIGFEGGKTDSTTGQKTYTVEEKNMAKEKAQLLLDGWLAEENHNEDSFAALANLNSKDSDGKDGGLYEKVYPGQMVSAFNDWCFDESRQPGDTGLVETEYGYHVMYFVKTHETTYRDYMIENDLITEDSEKWMKAITDAVSVTKVNLSGMETDYVMGY